MEGDALERGEAELGHALPAAFRQSLRRHDGQPFAAAGLVDGTPLLSLEDALDEWRSWCELEEGGERDDAPGSADAPVDARWWQAGRLPFAGADGNYLCLDLAPAAGGRVGQVIATWHDAPARPVVAEDFAGWLTALADDLDAGLLRVDPAGLVAAPGATPRSGWPQP